jgi:hypothetical protein
MQIMKKWSLLSGLGRREVDSCCPAPYVSIQYFSYILAFVSRGEAYTAGGVVVDVRDMVLVLYRVLASDTSAQSWPFWKPQLGAGREAHTAGGVLVVVHETVWVLPRTLASETFNGPRLPARELPFGRKGVHGRRNAYRVIGSRVPVRTEAKVLLSSSILILLVNN